MVALYNRADHYIFWSYSICVPDPWLFCVVVNLVIHVSLGLLYISVVVLLFMITLWNRADHYIFILWFLLMAALCNRGAIIFLPCNFYLLLFFIPRLISAAAGWMSTVL